jgi:putative membrane protein
MRKSAKYSQADTSLSVGSFQEAKSYLLKIGNSSIVSVSRAPHTTEDINFGVGLSLINLAKKDFDSVMLVDQHNSETGEITSFEPGSIVGHNYQMAIEDSLKKVAQSKNCPLKVGYSESGILKSSSIGNAGIKVVSISTDPISLIILIDSNGVSPQFKDQLDRSAIDAAKSLGYSIVPMVCTTDTHQLNNVRGVLNPLKEEGETLSLVSSLVKKSLEDMSPSTYFASSSWVDIKVIGAKQSIELISTVNSIVAISKFILPLILLASLLLLVTVATSI